MALILVVDDAQFMRMRLTKVLEEEGHEVIEAENGLKAVEAYKEHRPDLVLMDITMPEMDGLDALRTIRSEDPDACVVMCTALGQKSVVIEALKAGARDFIVKPFQPDKVREIVSKQVG